jgi:tetratricopeptide (TPR) repeat protein
LALKRNLPEVGARYFKDALAAAPGAPEVLAQLSVLTGEARYAARLRRYFDEADVCYFLGLASMEQNKYDSAVDFFMKLHEFVPDYWDGEVLLAAALSGAGRYRESADRYRSAMSRNADTLIFPEKIVTAFRRLAQDAASDAAEHYMYGMVLHQAGDLTAAGNVLRRSYRASGRKVVADALRKVDESTRGAAAGQRQ